MENFDYLSQKEELIKYLSLTSNSYEKAQKNEPCSKLLKIQYDIRSFLDKLIRKKQHDNIPIFLLYNHKRINELLLDDSKDEPFFYFDHWIEPKKVSFFFHMINLINQDEVGNYYLYSPEIFNEAFDSFIYVKDKNSQKYKQAIIWKILVELIKGKENFGELDDEVEKGQDHFNKLSKKFLKLTDPDKYLSNIKNELKSEQDWENWNKEKLMEITLEEFYFEIIKKLFLAHKFEDFPYITKVFEQMELQSNMSNVIFTKINELLDSKDHEEYLDNFKIKSINDLFVPKKIDFNYILIYYLFKGSINFFLDNNFLKNNKKAIIKIVSKQFKKDDYPLSSINLDENFKLENLKTVVINLTDKTHYYRIIRHIIIDINLPYYKFFKFDSKFKTIEKAKIEYDKTKNINEFILKVEDYFIDFKEANKDRKDFIDFIKEKMKKKNEKLVLDCPQYWYGIEKCINDGKIRHMKKNFKKIALELYENDDYKKKLRNLCQEEKLNFFIKTVKGIIPEGKEHDKNKENLPKQDIKLTHNINDIKKINNINDKNDKKINNMNNNQKKQNIEELPKEYIINNDVIANLSTSISLSGQKNFEITYGYYITRVGYIKTEEPGIIFNFENQNKNIMPVEFSFKVHCLCLIRKIVNEIKQKSSKNIYMELNGQGDGNIKKYKIEKDNSLKEGDYEMIYLLLGGFDEENRKGKIKIYEINVDYDNRKNLTLTNSCDINISDESLNEVPVSQIKFEKEEGKILIGSKDKILYNLPFTRIENY